MNQTTANRLRLLALGIGGLFFLWLPIEDTNFYAALLLSTAMCGLGTAASIFHWRQFRLVSLAIAGAFAGFSIIPAAILLLIFKSGIHAHGYPDFTIEELTVLLSRIPIWIAGGVLCGLGIGLLLHNKFPHKDG